MTEAVDLERMMIQLEANSNKLDKDFKHAISIVNSSSDRMELRIAKMKVNMEKNFTSMGTSAAKNFTSALVTGLSFAAIEEFVRRTTDSVENIEKQSKALGISTATYQAWGLSAQKAGIDQDKVNTALDFFSKNLGLAQLKTTPFGTALKKLGVDIHAGPEQAFYQFIDAVNKVGSASQRNAVITLGMGKGSVEMAGFIAQGSAALREQQRVFIETGEIIDEKAIEKILKLKKAWIDVKAELSVAGANVLAGFGDQFEKFTGGVESPQFQTSLKQFGATLATIVKSFIDISSSPYFKYLVAAGVGYKVGGLPGAAFGLGAAAGSDMDPLAGTDPSNDDTRAAGVLKALLRRRIELNVSLQTADPFLDKEQVKKDLHQLDLVNKAISNIQAKIRDSKPIYQTKLNINPFAPTQGGGIDLTGSLNPPKHAYADAVRELTTKTQQLAKAQDESAEATAEAEAKTKLIQAAQTDGLKITPALTKQIDSLAVAYGKVVAARAFDKSLQDEDSQIAKLKAEARQAELTKQALSELEERQKLMADFHKAFGDNAVPNTQQQADIDKRARNFGLATAGDEFSKPLKQTQDQDAALRDQIATIGLYGGALAEAQKRLELINEAAKNFDLTTEEGQRAFAALLPEIDAAARKFGQLTQEQIDGMKAESDRVQVVDELRSGLESAALAGLHGFKSMRDAAAQFLEQLAELIIKLYVLEPLMNAVLGKPGEGGRGGFLSSIFSDIFGSTKPAQAPPGTAAAPAIPGGITGGATPANPLYVSVVGGLPGAIGGGSSGGFLSDIFGGGGGIEPVTVTPPVQLGEAGGGFFSWLSGLLGFAEGGPVDQASPGMVRGPGGPTDDKVLARLSDKEYVVKATATSKHRPLLDALNFGTEDDVSRATQSYRPKPNSIIWRAALDAAGIPQPRRVPGRPSAQRRFADGGAVDGSDPSLTRSIAAPNFGLRDAPALPRVPAAGRANNTTHLIFAPQIDARGATEGTAAMIDNKLRAAFVPFLAAADRQTRAKFPEYTRVTARDHF